MATLTLSRGSSPVLGITMYETEAEDSPPLDLTGVPVEIFEHNLPIDPTIEVVDAPAGRADLTFPDTTPMEEARSHTIRLRIGEPGEPGTFTVEFEVIAQ